MEIKDIKSLIKMVVETDISEFEYETGEEKIRIQRGVPASMMASVAVSPSLAVPQHVAMPAQVMQQPAAEIVPSVQAPVTETTKTQTITSPIVGTLYRASSPDAPPYVEVGQTVEKGQVLCIVEAMKLMNEIEAEYRCKIVKICKDNAQPVEYGEELFVVEPL